MEEQLETSTAGEQLRYYRDGVFRLPRAVRDRHAARRDSVEATIRDVDSCDLVESDRAAVYAGNAIRLFGIS